MEYNVSSPQAGLIVVVADDKRDTEEKDEKNASRALIVWYLIGLITVLMITVLIISFCKYHKRQKKKKTHNHDYIRANLPLVRPRILPPSMNMRTGMGHNPLHYDQQVSCQRPYIGYESVPMDDAFESQYKVFSPCTDQNLIDLDNIELKEFSYATEVTVHDYDTSKFTYSESFADFENLDQKRETYKPTFQPIKRNFTSNNRNQDMETQASRSRDSTVFHANFSTWSDKDGPKQCFKIDDYKLFELPRPVMQTTCLSDQSNKANSNDNEVR